MAFASDPSLWPFAPRFVQLERPNQDGRFRVRGLAPGEFLLAALEHVDGTEWRDPEFLARVRPFATPVTVREGVGPPLTLRLVLWGFTMTPPPISRAALVLLGAVLAGAAADPARQARPGQPTAPAADQKATGQIHGCVVAGDTGGPLRDAGVQAIATSVGIVRGTATDSTGCYNLANLPAADYVVRVSKETYATVGYGEDPESGREEQTVPVSGETTMAKIDFRVPKAGVIAGRVLDGAGEPVPNVRVQALSVAARSGVEEPNAFPYQPSARTTDDLGRFRMFGLPAGDYVLLASPAPQAGKMPVELSEFTPTYFPGSPSLAAAVVLSVKVGQEHRGVDIVLAAKTQPGK